MLRNEPALAPACRPVKVVPVTFANPNGGSETRECTNLRAVVTHNGRHWQDDGGVSSKFRLLDNRVYLDAMDAVQARYGLAFKPGRAFAHRGDGGQYVTARYQGGRSRIVLTDESARYAVPGGVSSVAPTLALDNSYIGTAHASMETGLVEYHCSNLLLWGVRYSEHREQKHMGAREAGPFTLEEILAWIAPAFEGIKARMAQDREHVALLAASRPDVATLVEKLIKETSLPEKYAKPLMAAQVRYAARSAPSAWSVVQAATEIVAHEWTRKGAPTWAGQAWLERALAEVDIAAGIAR